MIPLRTLRAIDHYPAAQRMIADFEYRYNELRHERLAVIEVMRHEGNGSRPILPHAPSSVGAATIRASTPRRVRDSFDARQASDRSSTRPQSPLTHRKDVERNLYIPREHRSDCISYRAPLWLIEAFGSETAVRIMAHTGSLMSDPESDAKTRKPAPKAVDRKSASDAAARTAATPSLLFRHDYTIG